MSTNHYDERWQAAEPFDVAGVTVPAVACPQCARRIVDAARSRTLHASVTCPVLLSTGDSRVNEGGS
jgi:hypothetical protein